MALSSDLLLNVPDFGEGVFHRHPMHTPVIELFLYILLELLDVVGSHNFEKHLPLLLLLLSESRFL